jgi:hypothetical protein
LYAYNAGQDNEGNYGGVSFDLTVGEHTYEIDINNEQVIVRKPEPSYPKLHVWLDIGVTFGFIQKVAVYGKSDQRRRAVSKGPF